MISCVWFNLLNLLRISLEPRLYGLDMQTKHHIKGMHFVPIHSSKKKRSFTVECLPEKWHLNVPYTVHDGDIFCVLKPATILLPAICIWTHLKKKGSSDPARIQTWVSEFQSDDWVTGVLLDWRIDGVAPHI